MLNHSNKRNEEFSPFILYAKIKNVVKIRLARPEEQPLIAYLEKRLELEVPCLEVNETWLLEVGEEPTGLARITDLGSAFFLSSVGIVPEKRGQGLARKLLETILEGREKDIYLYTIIPEFFFRFGFETTSPASFLPPRTLFSCHLCEPERCFCLVRRKAGKRFSSDMF
jgi:N-acetylglutamate synthase-like GNAT family acetyltransferase